MKLTRKTIRWLLIVLNVGFALVSMIIFTIDKTEIEKHFPRVDNFLKSEPKPPNGFEIVNTPERERDLNLCRELDLIDNNRKIEAEAEEIATTVVLVSLALWFLYWVSTRISLQKIKAYLFPNYDIAAVWLGVILLLIVAGNTRCVEFFTIPIISGVMATIYTHRRTKK